MAASSPSLTQTARYVLCADPRSLGTRTPASFSDRLSSSPPPFYRQLRFISYFVFLLSRALCRCYFVSILQSHQIKVSMDGKGRAFDNIFVERLWRSLKYELVYINELESVADAKQKIGDYFKFYNNKRLHQSLKYQTPYEVYYAQ